MLYSIFSFLEGHNLILLLVFGFLMLLHNMVPTPSRSAHSVLDRTLGAHSSEILGTVRQVLALRYSCLLEKYTVTLYAMVPVVCPHWGLMGS